MKTSFVLTKDGKAVRTISPKEFIKSGKAYYDDNLGLSIWIQTKDGTILAEVSHTSVYLAGKEKPNGN